MQRGAVQNSRPSGRAAVPHFPGALFACERASVGGQGALRPYLVGYPILDNCEIWRPHAPVRAERLNGGVLSWMLGLARRLSFSYLGGRHLRSPRARRADARTPLLHLNAEGRDKTERRGVRGGGEGDGKLETLTRRGWSGSEPKEDGDEQSHEFFNENDNRSRQTEAKGREPVHRHDRKPTLRSPERSGRGGAIDTQMPWNYMCDHVIRRARLSLYDADGNTAKRNRTGKRLISLS